MIESPPNTSAPQRSADGLWEWNGTQWIAAQPPPGPQQVAQSAPFVQSPPQVPVKKKGHLVRNVGIIAGALLLVGIGSALASSGGSNNNSTAGTTTASSPSVTAAPTAKATVAPVVVAPKVLFDKTGQGISNTAMFTTPSEWTLTYNFDCTAFGYAGNFIVSVYDGGSSYVDTPVNGLAMKGTDTVYMHNLSGPYYLSINSECNWHVTVNG